MRTLFVGAGATGGYFGGRLAQAGRDVTFLVRPRRAEALAASGLVLHDCDGRTTATTPRVVTTDTLDGEYDLVIFAVKGFALDSAMHDADAAVGDATVVLPFLNGMRHIDALTARFGDEQVYGGVCVVATMLESDGSIRQLNGQQRLTYGPLDGASTQRLPDVDDALSGAGFGAVASTHIRHDMWEKWVFLASIGAVTTLMRGTVGDVNGAPGGTVFARGVLDEAVAIATAAGFPPSAPFIGSLLDTLTDPDSDTTSSLYRDLMQGLPIEADEIIGDLVADARSFGVDAPLFRSAFTALSVYQARRRTAVAR